MKKIWIAVALLTLILSNGYWISKIFDIGITQTYLENSIEDNKTALEQTLRILPLVAKHGISKDSIISIAKQYAGDSLTFEKDGYLWVGKIGMKFDNQGQFVEAQRAWDPP